MTVTDAPTPIGSGGHRGASLTICGGNSNESASISWVWRSISDAEGTRVLPRTLALICEHGAWLIDDDDANDFGVGDTFAEALEDYKDSLVSVSGLDARRLGQVLTRKGMRADPSRDHVYYTRLTSCGLELRTKISHSERTIGISLVARMAKQCELKRCVLWEFRTASEHHTRQRT